MGNITIRVDDKLKREAARAADTLDVNLSQVVRKALRALVLLAKRHPDWETESPEPTAFAVTTGQATALAQRSSNRSQDRTLAAIESRIRHLEELERKNGLNRATREELRKLRLSQMSR